MKFPTFRVVLVLLALLSLPAFNYVYDTFKPQVEGRAAVAQLEDSDLTYGASRRVIVDRLIPVVYHGVVVGFVVLVAGHYVLVNRKHLFK